MAASLRETIRRDARIASGGCITDGPIAETKEQIGGYHLVECANLDEAIAMRIPTLPAGGAVGVRPVEHVTAVGVTFFLPVAIIHFLSPRVVVPVSGRDKWSVEREVIWFKKMRNYCALTVRLGVNILIGMAREKWRIAPSFSGEINVARGK